MFGPEHREEAFEIAATVAMPDNTLSEEKGPKHTYLKIADGWPLRSNSDRKSAKKEKIKIQIIHLHPFSILKTFR